MSILIFMNISRKKNFNKMIGTVKHLSVYLPIKSLLMITWQMSQ